MECIIIFPNFYSRGCYLCDRFHETGQVKGVCSVTTLEEGRSGLHFYGQ